MTDTTLPVPLPELEPCPFCGGSATKVHHYYANRLDDDGSHKHVVRFHGMCGECGATGKTFDTLREQHAEAKAIRHWNARACMAPLQEENAKLVRALREATESTTFMGEPVSRFLPCGHPRELLLKSAETGEPLYCELCDAQSGRRDAERMEQEYRERADALQSERASLADTAAAAIRNTCSMPHPIIGLNTDLRPHIWSLSYEANNQQAKARRLGDRADAVEAALKAALKHAKKNGMQGWPVFADMERLINPTGGES